MKIFLYPLLIEKPYLVIIVRKILYNREYLL